MMPWAVSVHGLIYVLFLFNVCQKWTTALAKLTNAVNKFKMPTGAPPSGKGESSCSKNKDTAKVQNEGQGKAEDDNFSSFFVV